MKNLFCRHKDNDALGNVSPLPAAQKDPSNASQTGESEPEFPESLAASRTLRVQYDAYWNHHTTVLVFDNNQAAEVYTIDARYRKPQMTIRSTVSNSKVATANFHALKTRIDMTLYGRQLTLESGGFLGVKYAYSSPALGGERMIWQPRKK